MSRATSQAPSRTLVRILLLLAVLLLFGGALGIGYAYFGVQRAFEAVDPLSAVTVVEDDREVLEVPDVGLFDLMQTMFGFDRPKTYLVLFLNNNEYRPGGGFMGSYGVVRVADGKLDIIKIEGSEILDWSAEDAPLPDPPQPMKDHLGVDKWYFRDANWSPDFAESGRQALTLYLTEGGAEANNIDAVIGISTSVLEELLALTGPITVEGLRFTSDNVQETLEYEVQYGFQDRGRTRAERKDVLASFGAALMDVVPGDAVRRPSTYIKTVRRLISEKQIFAWSPTPDIQAIIKAQQADGTLVQASGDSIHWSDANLGALKTDYAMERNLSYRIAPDGDGYVAELAMSYVHAGKFDWRTTRYLTYARGYMPEGAELLSASLTTADGVRAIPTSRVDTGTELGRAWAGYFLRIEPGETQTLTYRYRLPARITEQIRTGRYGLAAQKQLGSEQIGLTMTLDFGTNIDSAIPAEDSSDWGDHIYQYEQPFNTDTAILVELAK